MLTVCVPVFFVCVLVFLYLCLSFCIYVFVFSTCMFFPLTTVNLDILPEAKERLPHTSIIKSQNTNLCFCIGIDVHVFLKSLFQKS